MTKFFARAATTGAGSRLGVAEAAVSDVYFSADVETDGPIPGPYSMLSFALVVAGTFDGQRFRRPAAYEDHFYAELCPISEEFESEALAINGLDRDALLENGRAPVQAMQDAVRWIRDRCGPGKPILVAYPLSFDWSWLYWYFVRFAGESPFKHSGCFDIKTAVALKRGVPISAAGRNALPEELRPARRHTHHAVDDAIAQAEIFANVFESKWSEADDGR